MTVVLVGAAAIVGVVASIAQIVLRRRTELRPLIVSMLATIVLAGLAGGALSLAGLLHATATTGSLTAVDPAQAAASAIGALQAMGFSFFLVALLGGIAATVRASSLRKRAA